MKGMTPMCQYDSRCPTREHEREEHCRYANRRGRLRPGSFDAPAYPPHPSGFKPRPRSTPQKQWGFSDPVNKGATVSGGLSLVDLFLLLVVTNSWAEIHHRWEVASVAILALLVLLPLGLAGALSAQCTAWRVKGKERCKQPRRMFLQRCAESTHGHAAQPITWPELVATLCFLVFGVGSIMAARALEFL